MRHLALSIAFTLVLVLFGPPTAADDMAGADPGGGDSAAEVAFRDAYWAETTRGALNEALTGYAKASEADGPEAVRAQALYRLAVVQERLDRTGEAIRTLERLAAAFPQEASWLAKAQERLAEWTAVDLRTNFAEWYRRYLYSPEFQARVVEHVLALGSKAKASAATSELLTIGEPAIPALEVHLDSPNQDLRGRVVDILLQMGRVPEIRHLVATSSWRTRPANWGTLLALSPERKTELRAQIEGYERWPSALRAVLNDRAHWPSALLKAPERALLGALVEQPMDDTLRNGLLAIVGHFEGSDAYYSKVLAEALYERGLIPDEAARRWLVEGPPDLTELVLEWLAKGWLKGEPYWDVLLERMAATASDDPLQPKIVRAVVCAVSGMSPEAIDWASFTQTYLGARGIWVGLPSRQDWVRAGPEMRRRFLAEIVKRASDPDVAGQALSTLASEFSEDPELAPRLLAWVQDESLDPRVQKLAARYLGSHVTAETLDGTLAALERLPGAYAEVLVDQLAGHRRIQSLPWTEAQLLRLMDWLRGTEWASARGGRGLCRRLHEPRYRLENTIRLALKAPTRIWPEALEEKRIDFRAAAAEIVRTELPDAWERWTPAERAAALTLFRPFFHGTGSADLVPFFRTQLHAEGTSRPVKKLLAAALPQGVATLDDLRAAYDLTDPGEALDAALHLYAQYPHTLEVYEVLGAARRDPDPLRRLLFWNLWGTQEAVDLRRRVARDRLEDPSADHRKTALDWLATVRADGDADRFAKALADPEAKVRIAAATYLARQWNPEAVRALVQALDDPDAAVRDRVLETLEAIKEIETKKEYWREAVRKGEIRDR